MSFYAQKNEVKSALEKTNKPLISLNIFLMQECENLLHEDFLKGLLSFEYLIDALQLENLWSIKKETNYNGTEEHQNSIHMWDNGLADGIQGMEVCSS